MGFGLDILAPGNITRVMQQTQDIMTLPRPLLWHERAAQPEASDSEMTLRDKDYIYAADIIAMDAKALVRDAGEFKFDQHQSNKLKHGFALSESMIKTLDRIENDKFMDNDIISFRNYIAKKQAGLLVGIAQREEAMLNGMFQDGYNYEKLGIKIAGAAFGMPADLKFNPVAVWSNTSAAKPITDLIGCLQYAMHTYGEGYNRITMSYTALTQLIATDEFKNIYSNHAFTYAPPSAASTVSARAQSPRFYLSFLANFIGAAMADNSGGVGREVMIEIDEGQMREYASDGSVRVPVKFHPDPVVYFTNSADDGTSNGWDLGNGPVVEAIVGNMGGADIIGGGGFGASHYGPIGYATTADPQLNPPGFILWAVKWSVPRKHRDTCSAKLTVV